MKKQIITISREFGSGGRSIGKQLAERLGIPCYDKEIIEKVAYKTGFAEKYVENLGEHASARNWFEYSFVGRNIYGMSAEDYLWAKQREVVLELASEGPCVIVGRCADYILRERKDCLNVFIHADMDKRADRVVNLYGETDQAPKKRLQDKDRKRKLNYKYYTQQDWGMSQNYHITLDSGEIGIEKCVDILYDLVK